MVVISFFLRIFDKSEKSSFVRWLYYVFLPLFLLIDSLCFWVTWRLVILPELLTKDEVVKFLQDYEFGYRWYKIYKKDVVNPNTIEDTLKIDELRIIVQREWTKAIRDVISENTALDIEEFITLICRTNIHASSEGNVKWYSITLHYYRYLAIRQYFQFGLPIWISVASAIFLLARYVGHVLVAHHIYL